MRFKRSGPLIHIRIGDPDKLVSGNQTYLITYQVENTILFLQDHDELYWNVTGNHWKAPIREASVEVNLAVKNQSKKSLGACYTGVYGSSESDASLRLPETRGDSLRRGTFARGGVDDRLWMGQGEPLPHLLRGSSFYGTLILERTGYFFFPLFSLVRIMVTRVPEGRDPKVRESIAVQYEPPKFDNRPLTPAEVGTLVDEKLDPKDITSSIVGLGVKGYLRIEETKQEGLILDKKEYYLRKVKGPDSNLSPFETELIKCLFPVDPAYLSIRSKKQVLCLFTRFKENPFMEISSEKDILQ